MPRAPSSLMTALGFSRATDRVYHRVLAQSGRELVSVAEALLRSPEELLRELAPLIDVGIVHVEDNRVFVSTPAEAVSRMLDETATSAARAHARLGDISQAIPFLTATGTRPAPGEVHDVLPLDGEVSSGGNIPGLLTALLTQSAGDVLQLRPDQWRTAGPDPVTDVLREVVASGRRLRSIYPLRALQEGRPVLEARAELGEEIRLIADVPTRMLILGTTHAILPEPLGFASEPRSLIRQRGVVEALTAWFSLLWQHATPAPFADQSEPRPDLRRFLLQQLAQGAQDEQIARRLGVSLRTVRRRVADVLSELGADTRFQAGAEAVRRGWL
ncbi:helix-turn-helix transcriptional regulator [Nocardioides sp. SYSU D00038]|uniref:helix-turn-helix domain-containing protein n=1 Tax=Nocardioides sp. SYSU D00038 TaxID=2812554 RepID=UPI0019677C28|nr:helix-turn-helix transcriptional regulator [Nocardioides sp. SYSU D00038]